MVFLCYLILWIFFVKLLTQLINLKLFFTSLFIAIGLSLICSDFKPWQQKLTLACILHLSRGVTVLQFFTTRRTFKHYVFYCTPFLQANYDISVLFKTCVIELAIYAWLWSSMEWFWCSVVFLSSDSVVMLVNVGMLSLLFWHSMSPFLRPL